MPKIDVLFHIRLSDGTKPIDGPHGPIFHRWLPNGLSDAITIPIGNSGTELKLYFKRRGKYDHSDFIEYSEEPLEDTKGTIERQAYLQAGPLTAILSSYAITDSELEMLKTSKEGDFEYAKLAKSFFKIAVPYIKRLVDVLRVFYGQYWIKEIQSFDSRKHHIGAYCANYLHMRWMEQGESEWKKIQPDKIIISFDSAFGTEEDYKHFLTQDDWTGIKKLVEQNYNPTIPGYFLRKSHQAFNNKNNAQALIQGVTSLELALEDFISNKTKGDPALNSALNSFKELSLPAKTTSILAITGKMDGNGIKNIIEAIRIRNEIVHEGKEPEEIGDEIKNSLLEVIGLLIENIELKFPDPNSGNTLYPKIKGNVGDNAV